MTVGLEFGIDQRIVYLDLEPTTVRRDQGQVPDIILELFQQFIRQAHGPVGIVSNSAVDDFDVFWHWVVLSKFSSLPVPIPQVQVNGGSERIEEP